MPKHVPAMVSEDVIKDLASKGHIATGPLPAGIDLSQSNIVNMRVHGSDFLVTGITINTSRPNLSVDDVFVVIAARIGNFGDRDFKGSLIITKKISFPSTNLDDIQSEDIFNLNLRRSGPYDGNNDKWVKLWEYTINDKSTIPLRDGQPIDVEITVARVGPQPKGEVAELKVYPNIATQRLKLQIPAKGALVVFPEPPPLEEGFSGPSNPVETRELHN